MNQCSAPRARWRSLLSLLAIIPVAVAASLVGAGTVLASMTNSMPAPVVVGILVLLPVAVLNLFLSGVFHKSSSRRYPLRLWVGLSCGVAVGLFNVLTPTEGLRRCFGVSSPSGITNISVRGYYVRGVPGGASDKVIFLRCDPDPETLSRLLMGRPFKRDVDTEQEWFDNGNSGRTRAMIWKSLIGWPAKPYGDASWQSPPIMPEVQIFRWESDRRLEAVSVLVDIDHNRVYALYTLG